METDDSSSIVSTAFTNVSDDVKDQKFLFVKSEDIEIESDVEDEDDHFFNIKSEPGEPSESGEDWIGPSNEKWEETSELEDPQGKREVVSNGKCRRKKVSEMTPEELELTRMKWREERRRRRQNQAPGNRTYKLVSEMTPEEYARRMERSRRDAERRKQLRWELKRQRLEQNEGQTRKTRKTVSEMTPEELEKKREEWRRNKERRKLKLNQMNPTEMDVKSESDESSGKEKSTYKRKCEMTPEELEKKREQWRRDSKRRTQRRHEQRRQLQLNQLGGEGNAPERIIRTHKRISEMTPEELAKKREQWRRDSERRKQRRWEQKRQRLNQSGEEGNATEVKVEKEDESSSEMTPEESKRTRANSTRKKKQFNMTQFFTEKECQSMLKSLTPEEELERRRASDRERKRMVYQRKKLSRMPDMTPELLEQRMAEWLQVQNRKKEEEQGKIRKTKKRKLLAEMTPEEKEIWKMEKREAGRKYAQRKRLERRNWSEQQKKDFKDKRRLYYLQRRSKMTEAQLAEERMQGYIKYLNRMARMTPEELEEHKKKRKEYKLRCKMTMTPEQLQRQRKKAMQKETDKKRRERMARAHETLEEKKRRWQETHKLAERCRIMQKRAAIQEMMSKGMSLSEIGSQFETPEQRVIRLHKTRVRNAKRIARNKLEAAGASQEEIQAKLKDIEENYVSKRALRPPKVLPQRWLPLPIDEEKLKNSNIRNKITTLAPVTPVPLPDVPSEVNSNSSSEQQFQVQPDNYAQNQNLWETSPHVQQQSPSHSCESPQPSPPPASSTCTIEDPKPENDSSTCDTPPTILELNPTQIQVSPTSSNLSEPKRKVGRPRKTDISLSSTKKVKKPTGKPTKDIVKDAICDVCGNAYSQSYLQMHKNLVHNPSFKNGECLLCGEKFTVSREFYNHWKKEHEVKCVQSQRLRRAKGPPGLFSRRNKKAPFPFICDTCGNTYSSKGALNSHYHLMHGAGSHRENYLRCELCPGSKKLFRSKLHLKLHRERKHGINRIKCWRCTERFKTLSALSSHVEEIHPESYWPCKHCGTLKFSVWGLNLHWSSRQCTKIPEEEWLQWKNNPENVCFQFLPLPCEFCGLQIESRHLKRHYRVVHNASEDKFKCFTCEKEFSTREHWAVHMIDFHNLDVEECKERVSKLFAQGSVAIILENKRATRKQVWNGEDHEDQKCSGDDPSTFTCPFCNLPRKTKIGLDYHVYTNKCKVTRSEWLKWTRNPKNPTFDFVRLTCEICNKRISCAWLTDHYKKIHKITENKGFKCWHMECDRVLGKRQTWGVHMIEDHLMDVEEVKEKIGKVNVDEGRRAEVLKMAVTQMNKGGRKKRQKSLSEEEDDMDEDFDKISASRRSLRGTSRKLYNEVDEREEDDDIKSEMEEDIKPWELCSVEHSSDNMNPVVRLVRLGLKSVNEIVKTET